MDENDKKLNRERNEGGGDSIQGNTGLAPSA